MLDIKYIRENSEEVKQNCKNRKVSVDIDLLLSVDEKRRNIETKLGDFRATKNKNSKTKPTPELVEEMKKLGEEVKALEAQQVEIDAQYRELILQVPNRTHPDVNVSDDEDDNPVVETFMGPKEFDFEALDHVALAEKHDLIDFDRATKIAGAKFYYLKNELTIIELALIRYTMDIAMKHGFTPVTTPDIAKREVLEGLGFNPRGESTQVYNIENTDLSLVGTAEITMGGYHMDEVLDESELPKKYIALSHCFRTEAGSYSKFSKGIFRVHQFTKAEMFQYVVPGKSEEAHQEMLAIEKEVFEGLEIPFRVVDHCTADLGGPSYRTYDLEAWLPGKPNKNEGMGDWGEITSTSNCTDYQARGLNVKYIDATGKKDYVHMLNGTAVSLARAMIALLETHQQADGSINIPEKLRPYTGFDKIG